MSLMIQTLIMIFLFLGILFMLCNISIILYKNKKIMDAIRRAKMRKSLIFIRRRREDVNWTILESEKKL